jgi:hypothetical protein
MNEPRTTRRRRHTPIGRKLIAVALICGNAPVLARAQPVPPSPAPTIAAQAPATKHRVPFVRIGFEAVYLYESWTPSGATPGAAYEGWGTALDTAVGVNIRPGLIVGGRWQVAGVVDLNEVFQGLTFVPTHQVRLMNTIGAFVDGSPVRWRGLHVGGGAGLLAASTLDRNYGALSTGWGGTLWLQAGYERHFSRRWSAGVLVGLAGYRTWSDEAAVSSATNGLLTTLALAFTFD